MSEFNYLITELEKFRNARNGEQSHYSKDLAIAVSIEAA